MQASICGIACGECPRRKNKLHHNEGLGRYIRAPHRLLSRIGITSFLQFIFCSCRTTNKLVILSLRIRLPNPSTPEIWPAPPPAPCVRLRHPQNGRHHPRANRQFELHSPLSARPLLSTTIFNKSQLKDRSSFLYISSQNGICSINCACCSTYLLAALRNQESSAGPAESSTWGDSHADCHLFITGYYLMAPPDEQRLALLTLIENHSRKSCWFFMMYAPKAARTHPCVSSCRTPLIHCRATSTREMSLSYWAPPRMNWAFVSG